MEDYLKAIVSQLHQIERTQSGAMEKTAALLAQTISRKNSVYIFGCSHSSIMAQEMFYRAGGFALINPIFAPGLTLETPPVTRTTRFERIAGVAEAVLRESPITSGDTLIICSISGRNIVPVEMAEYARENGISTVAVTSVAYAESVESRHPSGKKLHELADLVLDCCSVPGDAVLDIEGLPVKTAATSTITSIAMLHPVMARTIELLIEAGHAAPVFLSANVDQGDRHNARLLSEYRDQIHYL
ncbi:SIS domain-containing protein [Paenibacillus spongiae]|uniref:SIS domain-containing protein n=1 Tax=Paenibacillus spongiae TaxID=2909671 RepID=A0ABY5S396_9BACL|nr:SIS domain-containing protein [Paenibacillus spongiae]UVI28367.1 SIS domain-containing protein [Paenibacillus spongiae]